MADDIVERLGCALVSHGSAEQSCGECAYCLAAAEIERLTQHSVILNRVSWQLHDALGMIPEGADSYWGDIEATLPMICQIIKEARRG